MTHRSFALKAFIKAENGTGRRKPLARFFASSSAVFQQRLAGKVALTTGSSDGIGLAIAKNLGENGAKVVISSRKEENVSKATEALRKEGLDVKGVVCHVSKSEHRENLIDFTMQEYGSIDILVSNAATNPIMGTSIVETKPDAWDKIFDVNVKSAFFLVQSCLKHMKSKGGSVILVSSIAGFHPYTGLGAYSTSKAALYGMTKALALECAPMNIRVNCIAPGVIKTKFADHLLNDEVFIDYYMKVCHQKRIGNPEDLVGLSTFLASDDSAYLTGEVITAAGGIPAHL